MEFNFSKHNKSINELFCFRHDPFDLSDILGGDDGDDDDNVSSHTKHTNNKPRSTKKAADADSATAISSSTSACVSIGMKKY